MAISLKKVIATVVAGAAALVAVSASADVVLPSTGNGELVLFVRNDVTGDVYARGLGVQLDTVLSQASIASGAYSAPSEAVPYVLPTMGPDANLTSFLGTAGTFSWTIMGGDPTGAVALGDKRYVTTTPTNLTDGTTVSIAQVSSNFNNLNQMLIAVNNALPDASGSSTVVNGQWRQAGATPGSGGGDWFSASLNNVNDIGSSANFYMLTTAVGSGTQTVRVYEFADVKLGADGTLSASPVPLPAAIWLLGTGLAGLAGVGRRRRAA
jgi:hypothetical protein